MTENIWSFDFFIERTMFLDSNWVFLRLLVDRHMNQLLKQYFPLVPTVGMIIYLVVFYLAAAAYPGGSINIPNDVGYSFFHNFLCDAMNPVTQAGTVNDARPMAIVSHVILSGTMISFFYILPEIFSVKNLNTKLIRIFGVLTMTAFIFMYTAYHDTIVTVTAVLGTSALIPFFIELRKYKNNGLKALAVLCYVLSFIVFLIFVSKIGFYYLPFIQKITFFFDAWWVIWVSLIVYNKRQNLGAV